MSAHKLRVLGAKLVTSSLHPRPMPTVFYYPGLTSQQFHDKNRFPFSALLESNVGVIRNEFKELRERYKVNDFTADEKEHVLNQGTMQWMKFMHLGKPNQALRQLCPKTTKLLDNVPDLLTGISFGNTYFSCLGVKSDLKLHTGPCNIKLRCHLPLSVGDAYIRVGGKFMPWEEGRLLIFDETYQHEESNIDTEKERVLLVFDIWHPDLSLEERRLIHSQCQEIVPTDGKTKAKPEAKAEGKSAK